MSSGQRGGIKNREEHESKGIHKEAQRRLQDHSSQRQAVCDQQKESKV